MKNLRPPAFDGSAAFRDVVEGKSGSRRVRLRHLFPRVRIRQRRFQVSTANLTQLPVWTILTNRQKADLIHCYEVPTKALDRLCAQIRNAQEFNLQSQCQYCGVNPLAETFDHYLPKEEFAEFSAFAQNLLPCCRDCNNKKGRAWKRAGRRVVLNLYYDELPRTRYLTARVVFDDNKPTVRFSFRSNVRLFGGKRRLIRAHFAELDLLNVYDKAASIEIGEQVKLIGSLKPDLTRVQIASVFRRQASKLSRQFSPNYWKVPLLLAIAASSRCLAM